MRLQSLNPQQLVGNRFDRPRRHGNAFCRTSFYQLVFQELLKLHRFHKPQLALILRMQADNVFNNQIGQTLLNLRFHDKQLAAASLIPAHDNRTRVAAGSRFAERRVERAEIHQIGGQFRPKLHGLGKRCIFTAHRIILIFRIESCMSVAGADFHQCQHAARRPRGFRPAFHFRFIRLIERIGHQLAFIAVQLFPSVPQIHAVGPFQHGFKLDAFPKRIIERSVQHTVVMQNRADINHIVFLPHAAERQHGFRQPRIELVALFGISDLFVVFNIVQNSQVGAVRAVAQSAQLFAAARHLHLDVVGRYDGTCLPHAALAADIRKIGFQAGVKLQFRFDGFKHRVCLVYAVHHNHAVMLASRYNAPQSKQLRHLRRFTLAARRANRFVLAFRGFDDFR